MMTNNKLLMGLMVAAALVTLGRGALGAEEAAKATAAEKNFIMKAANGGMMEVQMGQTAKDKGGSDAVKDFGSQMVKDHSDANENLKEVAAKLQVEVPAKLDAKHQAKVDKLAGISDGAAFDRAYVKEMIEDHEKDIAEFKQAQGTVKDEDLKGFIEKTVPVMQHHLDMIKKFDQAKK